MSLAGSGAQFAELRIELLLRRIADALRPPSLAERVAHEHVDTNSGHTVEYGKQTIVCQACGPLAEA